MPALFKLTGDIVWHDTVTLVSLLFFQSLNMDRVRVPDLGEFTERLEHKDKRDKHSKTLLREPCDISNLKRKENSHYTYHYTC